MEPFSDEADVEQLCTRGYDEYELQNYRQAINHYERALEFGKALMCMESLIDIRMILAVCFFHLESYPDVVKYDRATLKLLKASPDYSIDHDDTIETRYRLARALASVSKSDSRCYRKWKDAVTLYLENLNLATDKDALSKTRKGLVSVYFKLCQYSEARDIYEQLLDKPRTGFLDGKDDESLELKHEYAAVLYHHGRHKKSKELFSQIEETISSLPKLRKRKLKQMSEDVDKYLAACFEATVDLDRGVQKTVAAFKEQTDSSPAPVEQSAAESASHEAHRSGSSTETAGKKISGAKKPSKPNEAASLTTLSVYTFLRLAVQIVACTVEAETPLQIGVQIITFSSIEFKSRSDSESNPKSTASPSRKRPSSDRISSRETNSTSPKREQTGSGDVIPRKKNSASPSPKQTSSKDVTSGGKDRALHRSKQTGSQDVTSDEKDPNNKSASLITSEPRYNRSVSAPSSSAISSAESLSPKTPSKRSTAQGKIPMIKIQVPGSWPEDSSSPPKNVQKARERTPPRSKKQQSSARKDTSSSGPKKPESPKRKSSASSEIGRLFGSPEGINNADMWFHMLRTHTHKLLYDEEPKVPDRDRKPVRVAILDSGLAENCDETKVPMARQNRRKVRAGKITYKDFTGESPSRGDSRENLHGTLCASFLMQVAPRAEVYVANVVQPNKVGQQARHVAKAIKWAIDQKVDVISMSFGWEHEKPEVSEQIDRAKGKGILLFAAASNDGGFAPEHGVYPGSHPLVYCIYSCDKFGKCSNFSPGFTNNAGNFMFPGEDLAILEADHKSVKGSVRQHGTSFATPIAAGTAAMVLDLARHELKDSVEVERRLRDYTGMSAVFQAMSRGTGNGGQHHVKPWKLLGESKPVDSLHNPNVSHQWFTLMNVLGHLQRFGPYQTPLS